jgi:hypothetical protein
LTDGLELTEAATRYRICGLTLASDIPLPELIRITGADLAQEPNIRVRVERAMPGRASPSNWFMVFALPTGAPGLACAKEPGGYWLRFPELADFRVDARGREIVCEAPEGIPHATIRHLLLDQVIPRTLSLLGVYALHATAVLTPQGVCAFAGLTGAGKSTLAASFHLAGYPVLSDDCLVLQEEDDAIVVTPAYPGVRLWDDAAAALCGDREGLLPVTHSSSKLRLLADSRQESYSSERKVLARIYNLVDAPETEEESVAEGRIVEAIPGGEAFMSLVTSVFRLDITDRGLLARQFDFFERVASLVPIRRLHVSPEFSALPALREAIFADLRVAGTGESVNFESEQA